jgi:hypothetical protein
MMTSLDGKITGDFLGKNPYGGLIADYYRIHREYGADGSRFMPTKCPAPSARKGVPTSGT